ncbi:MAG: DUF1566 domain-containing protein [Methylococcales bacterium]|nr:DUF1566 domain-containing protein [Methylococcales bacterium]
MRQTIRLVIVIGFVLQLSADVWLISHAYDATTKKFWQRCAAGQVYDGMHCKGAVLLLSWQKSLQYCTDLEGRRAWRLPTRNELLAYYFQHGQQQLIWRNLYWTSSTDVERPQLAWYLIPGLDWMVTNYKELDGISLCVADAP